jgi:hypothetical protein
MSNMKLTKAEKLKIALKALNSIIDPIGHMESQLEEGETLNGYYAVRISESSQFYKEIVQKALGEISCDYSLPKYVRLKNSAMRLVNDSEYYRDGGDWGVRFKILDGKLVSWAPELEEVGLHKIPLEEITHEEWKIDNEGYVPPHLK